MRVFINLLILILILFQASCASRNVDLKYLEGSWLLTENLEEGTLKYQRIVKESRIAGSILKISRDSIVDSFHMKCEGGMSSFFTEGSWSVDEKRLTLKSTIPIDLQGQIFKIKNLDSTNFILVQTKTRK